MHKKKTSTNPTPAHECTGGHTLVNEAIFACNDPSMTRGSRAAHTSRQRTHTPRNRNRVCMRVAPECGNKAHLDSKPILLLRSHPSRTPADHRRIRGGQPPSPTAWPSRGFKLCQLLSPDCHRRHLHPGPAFSSSEVWPLLVSLRRHKLRLGSRLPVGRDEGSS